MMVPAVQSFPPIAVLAACSCSVNAEQNQSAVTATGIKEKCASDSFESE